MPGDTVLILCLWGYGKALKLDCHWLKLVITLIIVLIFNELEQSVPFAIHCAEVSVNTECEVSANFTMRHQQEQGFVKPEKNVCQFCQAQIVFLIFLQTGIPATAGKVAAPHLPNF